MYFGDSRLLLFPSCLKNEAFVNEKDFPSAGRYGLYEPCHASGICSFEPFLWYISKIGFFEPIWFRACQETTQRMRTPLPFFRTLASDLPAGLVVFLVALPLCLGVATASGAPLLSGLVSGIIAGIIISGLSASSLSVSGPAAGMTAITLSAIGELGGYEYFLSALFLAGILQVFFGLIRAGRLGALFPNAVIRGMLFAIGLILILKQLPHAVGFGSDLMVDETYAPATPGFILGEIFRSFRSIEPGPIIVFVGSISIMQLWDGPLRDRYNQLCYLPGPFLAVLWGIAFDVLSQGTTVDIADQHMVTLNAPESIGHLLESLPAPKFNAILDANVALQGLEIAILASLETLLSIEAIDRLDPQHRATPKNRELIAQGVGNTLCGLFGGLPLTSVIVRSSANLHAGAKSRLASLIHGLLLLASTLFLVEWLNRIPLASLSAILIVTGYRLAHPSNIRQMWSRGINQFVPFSATVLAILIDDLLKGILIGTVIGLLYIIKSNFKSSISCTQDKNRYLVRFRKDVTFLNKSHLREVLDRVQPNSEVLIDGTRAEFIDRDILDCLVDFSDKARLSGTTVTLRNLLSLSGPLCAECLEELPESSQCSHN